MLANIAATMDNSCAEEVAYEDLPYLLAYKDGRVERFFGNDRVPASIESPDGVCSKDVVIVHQETTGRVSARIFMPARAMKPGQKLPLLVYYHGGKLYMGSPFCSLYHNYVSSLANRANVIAVSVDYRLAPENHVPAAYEDSWAALKWVASHSNNGQGPEAWLREYADFERFFLAGDSAGGNIVHNVALRAAVEGLNGVKLSGAILVQPYFGRKDGGTDAFWQFVCPTTSGFDDVRINPAVDSRLSRLGCTRVLICVAEKDNLRERGLFYYETLRDSGWVGKVEIAETEGEEHVFHLFNPNSEKAVALMDKLASFIGQLNASE